MIRRILNDNIPRVSIINEDLHVHPFIFSIPHSGMYLTEQMAQELHNDVVLANTDWYLPECYSFLYEQNYTVLINNVSRYVIDPNRGIEEGESSGYHSALIYTKTTFGKEMYSVALSNEEISSRIREFYQNYHSALQRLIAEKQKHFGKVYLIDLHSFGKNINTDVVLGNANGSTMQSDTLLCFQKAFSDEGFRTALNDPYSGGFITKHYGAKDSPCESLQIELSYNAYICKRDFTEEEHPSIDHLLMINCQRRLNRAFARIDTELDAIRKPMHPSYPEMI